VSVSGTVLVATLLAPASDAISALAQSRPRSLPDRRHARPAKKATTWRRSTRGA